MPETVLQQQIGQLEEVDGRELRMLAEWIDGAVNRELVLVRDPDKKHLTVKRPEEVTTRDALIMRVRTPSAVDHDVKVTLEAKGITTQQLDPTEYDAMFWSVPAYEKFVLPYYTSLRTLSGPDLEQLYKDLHSPKTVATIHRWPSWPFITTRKASAEGAFEIICANEDVPRDLIRGKGRS